MPAKTSKTQRKKPKRKQSVMIFNSVLDSTAQLLLRLGYKKTSTNKMAERAGVSIGSLYQYFPNKDAVILKLMERQIDQKLERTKQVIGEIAGDDVREANRRFIDFVVRDYMKERETLAVLFSSDPVVGILPFANRIREKSVRLLVESLSPYKEQIRKGDLEFMVFIAVNAVMGVIQTIIWEPEREVDIDQLIEELSYMTEAYLYNVPLKN